MITPFVFSGVWFTRVRRPLGASARCAQRPWYAKTKLEWHPGAGRPPTGGVGVNRAERYMAAGVAWERAGVQYGNRRLAAGILVVCVVVLLLRGVGPAWLPERPGSMCLVSLPEAGLGDSPGPGCRRGCPGPVRDHSPRRQDSHRRIMTGNGRQPLRGGQGHGNAVQPVRRDHAGGSSRQRPRGSTARAGRAVPSPDAAAMVTAGLFGLTAGAGLRHARRRWHRRRSRCGHRARPAPAQGAADKLLYGQRGDRYAALTGLGLAAVGGYSAG